MGRFSKRTVRDVSVLLQPGEALLGEPVAVERTTDDHGGVDGAPIREVGLLALTSHRLIFVGQILLTHTCVTAPLARLWSVSHNKSWSGQTLTVNMDGRWETFTPRWGDRRRLMSFARDVHMAATRAAQQPGQPPG